MTEPCEKHDKRVWERTAELKRILEEILDETEQSQIDTYKAAEDLANPYYSGADDYTHGLIERVLEGDELTEDEIEHLKDYVKDRYATKITDEIEYEVPDDPIEILEKLGLSNAGNDKARDRKEIMQRYIKEDVPIDDELVRRVIQVANQKMALGIKKPGKQTLIDSFDSGGYTGVIEKETVKNIAKQWESELKRAKFYPHERKEILLRILPDYLVTRNPKMLEGLKKFGNVRWQLKTAGYPHKEAHKIAKEVYHTWKKDPEKGFFKLQEYIHKKKKRIRI